MNEPAVRTSTGPSLKGQLVSSSVWVMGGMVAIQALRLLSTLVLSRMLAPEAFGVMAIVTTTLGAITLFSEVDLGGSIIHDKRGDDEIFLNTAWSLQLGRGVMITAVLCLLAAPMAGFYGEPQLSVLLPAIAANALMAGLSSTSLLTLTRQLAPRKTIIYRVLAKVVSLAVMLLCAWKWRSVWALVIGSLTEQLFVTASSYWLIPGYRNRLQYDKEIARSMLSYGRWVWGSAIATWLIGQGDKLILGKFLTAEELGVYTIATLLTSASITAIESLAQRVLQPFYAKLIRDDPKNLRKKTFKVRGALTLVVLPILWTLVFFGGFIVDLLYDSRYHEAGWMLRLMAVGAVATNVIRSAERVLLADGDSFRHMMVRVVGGALFLACLAVGGYVGGLLNMMLSIVAARFLAYVPLAVALKRRGVWLPQLDLAAFGSTILVAYLSYLLVPV